LEFAKENIAFLESLVEQQLGLTFWPILALQHNIIACLYRYADNAQKALEHGRRAWKVLKVSHKATKLVADLEELIREAETAVRFQPT